MSGAIAKGLNEAGLYYMGLRDTDSKDAIQSDFEQGKITLGQAVRRMNLLHPAQACDHERVSKRSIGWACDDCDEEVYPDHDAQHDK